MEITPEKSLWYLFVEGDVKAFSTFFKHYYPELHNYGLRITDNIIVTEDCLQSFFIHLYSNRKKLRDIKNIKAYLFVSFRRALLKDIKKEKKTTTLEDQLNSKMGFIFSSEEVWVNQESLKLKSETLAKLLNTLSVREKEAIYLKYYSALGSKEISEIMGISYQSVQNTLQKAFIKLKKESESSAILKILNA